MKISDVSDKDDFIAVVINELKEIGVKCRKEKRDKKVQEKICHKRIFHTHLNSLELTDVMSANGIVKVPKFVADACDHIFGQIDTEGIFRKAGSSLRQKSLRMSLESGLPLGKSHHCSVIDVANLLKYFFRELPEPIIPPMMQETFLRSLLVGENHVRAILLTCLLLPPLILNTISFFMQFLHSVTIHAHLNKMSAENLAIIFTPGLMPLANIASHRFTNHIKVVRLLIENANGIGTIPDSVIDKLQIKLQLSVDTPSQSSNLLENTQKKKKKRRSEMFNGLRKIVGNAIGSSENLENMPDAVTSDALATDKPNCLPRATPCLKATKKRKFTDPVCAFSAKKKRDLLALLPSNSGGLLPNTPQTKQQKKNRVSLGGNRHIKKTAINPIVSSIERRWSIVGSGWSKQKIKNISSGVSKNNVAGSVIELPDSSSDTILNCDASYHERKTDISNSDQMQISKIEYEAIKERVEAIESRISQEFGTIKESILDENCLSGPQRVLNKYEKMIIETEGLSSPTTEKLAQRLGRGLHIRQSIDQRVVRSPSARKIGTMRRRSQEKVRLSRTQTWHLSSSKSNLDQKNGQVSDSTQPNSFYAKSKLKRGRPNTFSTDRQQKEYTPVLSTEKNSSNDQWVSADIFFNNMQQSATKTSNQLLPPSSNIFQTPIKQKVHLKVTTNDIIQTPMLPPKTTSVQRRNANIKTPNSAMKFSTGKCPVSTPMDDGLHGRASIARLRTANAGMVMAKAKLFDRLGGTSSMEVEHKPLHLNKDGKIGRRQSLRCAPTPTIQLTEKTLEINLKQSSKGSPRIESKKTKDSPVGCVLKRNQATNGCKPALGGNSVTNNQSVQMRKVSNKSLSHNMKTIKKTVQKTNASPRASNMRNRVKANSPRRINKQFAGNELYEIFSPAKQSSKNFTRAHGRLKNGSNFAI